MPSTTSSYLDLLPEEIRQVIYEITFAEETDFTSSALLAALKDRPKLYEGAIVARNRVSATVGTENEVEFKKLPYAQRKKILNLKLVYNHNDPKDRRHLCPRLEGSSMRLLNNIETLSLDFSMCSVIVWTLSGYLLNASTNPRRLVVRLPAPLRPVSRLEFRSFWTYMSYRAQTMPRYLPEHLLGTKDWNENITTDHIPFAQMMEPPKDEVVLAPWRQLFLPRKSEIYEMNTLNGRVHCKNDYINMKFAGGVYGKLMRVSPLQYTEEWFWEDQSGKRLQLVDKCGSW